MKTLLKILVSATLLFFVFQNVHVKDMPSLLSAYSLQVLLGVVVLQFFALVVAAFKWQSFIPEYSLRSLFRFTLVGQFYSLVLPGQLLGEIAKAYHFSREESERGRLFASVAVDKITGIAGLLLVALLGVLCTKTILLDGWKMVILVFLGVASLGVFSLRFEWIKSFIERYASHLHFVASFVNAYHEYAKNTKLIVRTIFLGGLFQVFAVWITMILAHSLGINISFFDWLWIFSLVSVAVFVPVTIGGLGVREGVFVALLGFFAVSPVEAVTLSLSIFALQTLAGFVGGIEAWRLFGLRGRLK